MTSLKKFSFILPITIFVSILLGLVCFNCFAVADSETNDKTVVLDDGYYTIKPKYNENYALDVQWASFSRCANIQIYTSNETDAQVGKLENSDDGYFTLYNKNSGLALDVSGGIALDYQNIHTYFSNKSKAQKGSLESSDGGYILISALNRNYVLDINGANFSDCSNVQLYNKNYTKAQNWIFEKVEVEKETTPSLNLELNGYTLDQINSGSKDTKYSGNNLVIDDLISEHSYSDVEIKGRGNSTGYLEKKPYQIKFTDPTNLFGMGLSKKGVLLANYYDPTNIRTDVAFYYAQLLDMKYHGSGKFVNLYVDHEYIGLYYLTHKVEIGSSTVDLDDADDGILCEIDGRNPEADKKYFYSDLLDSYITLSDSALSSVTEDQAIYNFQNKWSRLESAIINHDGSTINSCIDVESFAKFSILSEITRCTDSYVASTFFYTDNTLNKIYCGPPWDYDISFGCTRMNIDYGADPFRSFLYHNGKYNIGSYLADFPEFRRILNKVYNEYCLYIKDDVIGKINSLQAAYSKDMIKNNTKYNIGDSNQFISELKDGINKRTQYLDVLYRQQCDIENNIYNIKSLSGKSLGSAIKLERLDDGYYRLIDTNDGLCFDVAGASLDENAMVHKYEGNGSDAQKWFFVKNDGNYYLVAKVTGLVLDFSDGLHVKDMNGSSSQLFNFNVSSIEVIHPDTKNFYEINSALEDNIGMGFDENNNILTRVAAAIDSANYQFILNQDNTYTIKEMSTGKVLDIDGNSMVDGSNISLHDNNGSNSQKGILKKMNKENEFSIVNVECGKCVDITTASKALGTNIQLYRINQTNAQIGRYSVPEKANIYKLAKDNMGTINEGTYTICSSINSSYSLDVVGGSLSDGANVQLYSSNGTNAQKGKISEDEDGFLTIKNVGSDKVLCVQYANITSGGNVWQYKLNNTYAQKGIAIKDGSYVKICSAVNPNYVLDLTGAFISNGTNIQVYKSNNTLAQRGLLKKRN